MAHWQRGTGQSPLIKLAQLAVRTQRLVVLQRLDQIQTLIHAHAPDIHSAPGGTAALQQATNQLQQARTMLHEASHG